jgi:hypothetical protein
MDRFVRSIGEFAGACVVLVPFIGLLVWGMWSLLKRTTLDRVLILIISYVCVAGGLWYLSGRSDPLFNVYEQITTLFWFIVGLARWEKPTPSYSQESPK